MLPQRPFITMRLRKAVSLIAVLSLVSGCSIFSPTPVPRGSLVEADDYDQLIPGSSTRADAIDLMGSPTTRGAFDDNTWIYISMTTYLRPANFPGIDKQQVVVLNFDNDGKLKTLRTLNRKDARPVSMISQVTPTPGTSINILQQILGNVGRYNPMQNLMGTGSATGQSQGLGNSNSGPGHFGSGNTL
ncbi:outer membrane protein assembly factor BamE [Acetobacter thailandicus]|nr:outer membrane protein assembly factor BamE [Acetobacter thailandicus]MBS1003744.1 outer membrane protein assembly factor BamE [Acetobacter thailandicus]NHN94512.1 outer membrane protein assembly factor BamE [Acetobacter thailandicus]